MKKALALLLSAAMALSLTACGGSSSTSGSTSTGSASESGAASSTASVKDTLNVAVSIEPYSLMCLDQNYVADKTRDCPILQQVYDNLTYIDKDGNVQLMLATDYTVSDDGLEYVFTIRDGVKFHNGEPLTAEDVAFSYNTAIEKAPAWANSMLNGLQEAVAVDDTHVKCILKFKSPAFLNMLATQMGIIICKSYYEEVGVDEYNKHPIGSGAYKFGEWASGEYITLEANDEYWGGAPAIKHVKYNIIPSVSTQFISLESGDIDVIMYADLASCTHITDSSIATWDQTMSSTRNSIFIDWPGSLRDDENLRKAMQCGINKQDILQGVLYGYGEVLDVDVVTGWPSSPTGYKVVEYDQEKAKEYLAASNYDGREIRCMVPTGTMQEKAAQIVQGQLQQIGITFTVVPCDSATLQGLLNTGTNDCYLNSNTNVWFDFCNPGASYNPDLERYTEEQVVPEYQTSKDLYAQIMQELDVDKRKALMTELMDFYTDHAYVIPLFAGVNSVAYNKKLNGVSAHPVGTLYFKDITWTE